MSLEYSIYDSNENYYEVNIPIGSYYKDEGLLLSATVRNSWRGFNNESFYWEKIEDKIILFDYYEEKVIAKLSLEEFKQWLYSLHDIYSGPEMFEPIMDILESLIINDKARVTISFY